MSEHFAVSAIKDEMVMEEEGSLVLEDYSVMMIVV